MPEQTGRSRRRDKCHPIGRYRFSSGQIKPLTVFVRSRSGSKNVQADVDPPTQRFRGDLAAGGFGREPDHFDDAAQHEVGQGRRVREVLDEPDARRVQQIAVGVRRPACASSRKRYLER